jgi:hypothetical protein
MAESERVGGRASAARPDGSALALEERIGVIIERLPAERVTLLELRELVGQDGLLLLAILLTLVFMVPVSIPGVSTVFGGGILLIGLCRLLNRPLWLPRALARRELPSARVGEALRKGALWLRRLERVSRAHRLPWLACGPAERANSVALMAGAALLMAPFGFVPFSNTLPALAILLLAVGLLRRDGLYVLSGHVANLLTAVYFGALILGGGAAAKAVAEALRKLFAS